MLIAVLLILAAVCFLLAAANAPIPRLNLVALGLLLWVITEIMGAVT